MRRAIAYFMVYVTVPSLVAAIAWGGWWNLATPIVAFLFIPVADALSGDDLWNPPASDKVAWAWLYQVPLYLWVPVHIGLLVWGIGESTTRTGWDFVGLTIAMGLFTGGVGIVIAHELMHRKAPHERAMAELLMLSVTYTHFCIEHVYGHHKNVATPHDAASSRLGESLYRFLPRVVVGSVRSAVDLEIKRAGRKGIKPWSMRHRLTRYGFLTLVMYAAVVAVFGLAGGLFLAAQSCVAIVLLETINYVEHYGLLRAEKSPGRYQRVGPEHSWNSSHRYSNYWLFNLQRHADHHAHASRPYHLLRTHTHGPQLPHGYPTMVLLAFVPSAWRRVMDPRVEALQYLTTVNMIS